MNLDLKQLQLLLIEYEKRYKAAEEKFDDPEYVAWISSFDKDCWPEGGIFAKARMDKDFRAFRSVYMDVVKVVKLAQKIPKSENSDYHNRFIKEYPDHVPI